MKFKYSKLALYLSMFMSILPMIFMFLLFTFLTTQWFLELTRGVSQGIVYSSVGLFILGIFLDLVIANKNSIDSPDDILDDHLL